MLVLTHLLLLLIAVPSSLSCFYLTVLTLLSKRPEPFTTTCAQPLFDIIVPAHDEATVISATVASLRALDWPADRYRIIVVADNCNDDTAVLARTAGAEVIERIQPELRGKGLALQYAFTASLQRTQDPCDAIVVIDADSQVSPNLLMAFASRLAHGAQVIQALHGVANPGASWRTRLAAVAYAASHAVRGRGRERLGVSCGLRGNGMCFTLELLRRHPFQLNSMAEDLEYGVQLGLSQIRVHYADEAQVNAEMSTSAKAASSQRRRWEFGRLEVLRSYCSPLLLTATRYRSGICLDLALDLITPPLGYLLLLIIALASISLGLSSWGPSLQFWSYWAMTLTLLLFMHVMRGWQLSQTGWRALLDLLRVPFFVLWKIYTLLRRREQQWTRTTRNNNSQ